jgi:hypothetical protein
MKILTIGLATLLLAGAGAGAYLGMGGCPGGVCPLTGEPIGGAAPAASAKPSCCPLEGAADAASQAPATAVAASLDGGPAASASECDGGEWRGRAARRVLRLEVRLRQARAGSRSVGVLPPRRRQAGKSCTDGVGGCCILPSVRSHPGPRSDVGVPT